MTTTLTRSAAVRPLRRSKLVLVGLVIAVVAVVVFAVELTAHSQTGGQRARVSLGSLTPVLPNLDRHEAIIISHPDCEVDPPCTSAAQTWSPLIGVPTFADLDRALSTWVIRNHLRNSGTTIWACSLSSGLFGTDGYTGRPGCATSFSGPKPNQTVFVATTFIDPTASMFGSVKYSSNGMSNAIAVLGSHALASLSVQVVGDNK